MLTHLRICDIVTKPTVLKITVSPEQIHESLFRSYYELELVKELLGRGVPSDIILGIVEHIEGLAATNLSFAELTSVKEN